MDAATVAGLCGSALAFTLFLPQARDTWRNRHRPERLQGISVLGQTVILANAAVWAAYAALTGAFWVGAPGLVNAPLAVWTIILLFRSRRTVSDHGACAACVAGIPHHVFVTAPPGFGSVMPCTVATRRHGVIVCSEQDFHALRRSRE